MKNSLLWLVLLLTASTYAQPYLCFSDLISGPAIGNSDNSQPSQVASKDGAIITVWGKRLGIGGIGSKIYIGGKEARIYTWGNAKSPADLFSMHQMQSISFQVPSTVPMGEVEIFAEVNGIRSNALKFRVREGKIRFVSVKGNDESGDGSYQKPWKTLDNNNYSGALSKLIPGDILYIMDTFIHTELAGDRACIDIGDPGTFSLPKSLIAYPNAYVQIGAPQVPKTFSLWVSGIGLSSNWVISKLNLMAKNEAISLFHNFRVVGNFISAPNGDGPTGAVTGLGNNLYLLGNELTKIGDSSTSKLYHPIYFQSHEACSGPRLPTERNREIAWNYLHDNLSYDGINLYRECGSSAYMTDHRVHDNVILNQTGCGIRCGDYVVGENHIYNNLIINCGLGPDPKTEQAMHVPLLIHAGWDDTLSQIHVYNNSIYGGGFNQGAEWASGMVGFSNNHPFSLDFRNNIIYSKVNKIEYINFRSDLPKGSENNSWYGAGLMPNWEKNGFNTDPIFVNPDQLNFRLRSTSPLIGKGKLNNGTINLAPELDFDCLPRNAELGFDLGAFEYRPIVSNSSDLEASNISVYPNPTNGQLVIRSNHQIDKINIYSLEGKHLIAYTKLDNIDLSELPSQILLIEIIDNSSKKEYFKVLKL